MFPELIFTKQVHFGFTQQEKIYNNFDFTNILVRKHWGGEQLLYENKSVGVWYLTIKKNKRTSLHNHPLKKTGLIVLKGVAEVEFLNGDKKIVNIGESIMFRPMVWHRTEALEELELLEIECPNDKFDLARLEDDFDRAGKEYEGREAYTKIKNFTINDDLYDAGTIVLGDCFLDLVKVKSVEELEILNEDKLMVLDGTISFSNFNALSPGDIINAKNALRLAKKFQLNPLFCLRVRKR